MSTTAFQVTTVNVPVASGFRRIGGTLVFPTDIVGSSAVALNGFNLDYLGADRNLGAIIVNANKVGTAANVLSFEVTCNLRDNSDNDEYSGSIDVVGMAVVA